MVALVSLGYAVLRDANEQEVIVPNSVMVRSVVLGPGGTGASLDSTAGITRRS